MSAASHVVDGMSLAHLSPVDEASAHYASKSEAK